MEHLTRFVNAVYGRKLSGSLGFYESIVSAIDHGYTEDEIRIAFWVVRCLPGDSWLRAKLQEGLAPAIVLRHQGGINRVTGSEAKRWLDDMVSRRLEMHPSVVGSVLRKLPDDLREGEEALLKRMEIPHE